MPWFTAIVALGVAMEFWVIWHEWRDETDTWALAHFGVVRSPSRPSKRKLLVEVGSVVLITAGIVGELWIGIKITSINGVLRSKNNELRNASDQLVAIINSEAEDAKKQAENERLEREKIQAAIAPRSLSLDQQHQISDACRRFHGHKVLVESYGIDSEAAALGAQVISVLRNAEIDVLDNRARVFFSGEFDVGIHIRGPSEENDFVSTLGKKLSSIGGLTVYTNDPLPKTTGAFFGGGPAFVSGTVFVKVTIGVKPLPVLGNTKTSAAK